MLFETTEGTDAILYLITFKTHFTKKQEPKKDLYYDEILLHVEFQTALRSLGRTMKFARVILYLFESY
jgi:hypothetical protein